MHRHILQARQIEGIGMGMVAVVAHQRATAALLVIELAARKP